MGALDKIRNRFKRNDMKPELSFLRDVVTGSLYRISNIRSDSDIDTILSMIATMRELAKDSQVETALSYYATDATSPNSSGDIIWATNVDDGNNYREKDEPAALINTLLKRWKVSTYARDHILELATIGNLYIPTTELIRPNAGNGRQKYIGLDQHMIPDDDFDIIASHKIPPETVLHIWKDYQPYGYLYDPSMGDKDNYISGSCGIDYELLPESSIIHFTLGGLIGEYSITGKNNSGDTVDYDIQFANPLLKSALKPTQTLNLLEDSTILSALIKTVRFICIECNGVDESEITPTLMHIKSLIEQQMSLNTASGDTQSYLNPQSPDSLIYLPRVNGQDPISILDLKMNDESEATNKLLEYYQDKKLSVLGIPKEALNFSSAEGLGGAGSVMSQRSALYANSLQRIENAYINGWKEAIDRYFKARNLPQYCGRYELHMNPILTELSTIQFERRDSAISQVTSIIEVMKELGVEDADQYRSTITEILLEALPKTSSKVSSWEVSVDTEEEQFE